MLRSVCRVLAVPVVVALFAIAGCSPQETPETSTPEASTPEISTPKHVAAYSEPLEPNQLWCAPMEICWNNAMDKFGPFREDNPSISALNSRPFDISAVSEDHYYAYSGLVGDPQRTYDEIDAALQEKFGQGSDALDPNDLNPEQMLFYSMLYRKFTYPQPFEADDDQSFTNSDGSIAHRVKVFETEGDEAAAKNITVLYYNDNADHAVAIKTNEGDVVVLVNKPKEDASAKEIMEDVWTRAASFNGNRSLEDDDEFSAPNLDFDVTDTFNQLIGAAPADTASGGWAVEQALQKTKFSLDNAGGEIKSEAAMVMANSLDDDKPTPRIFSYSDEYAVFLVDEQAPANTDMWSYKAAVPYFAARVSDITAFQDIPEDMVSPASGRSGNVSSSTMGDLAEPDYDDDDFSEMSDLAD